MILDFNMPELNGLQVVQALNEMCEKAGVPRPEVAMVSAYITAEVKVRLEACGVKMFYDKPIRAKILRKVLREFKFI